MIYLTNDLAYFEDQVKVDLEAEVRTFPSTFKFSSGSFKTSTKPEIEDEKSEFHSIHIHTNGRGGYPFYPSDVWLHLVPGTKMQGWVPFFALYVLFQVSTWVPIGGGPKKNVGKPHFRVT